MSTFEYEPYTPVVEVVPAAVVALGDADDARHERHRLGHEDAPGLGDDVEAPGVRLEHRPQPAATSSSEATGESYETGKPPPMSSVSKRTPKRASRSRHELERLGAASAKRRGIVELAADVEAEARDPDAAVRAPARRGARPRTGPTPNLLDRSLFACGLR